MIKLFASDMDGTLLGPDGKITEKTARTVKELQQSGVRFVACTGRNYAEARQPLEECGIVCDLICMNGAAVFDAAGRQIFRRALSIDQVHFIMEACRKEVVFDFMTDRGSCTLTTREQFKKYFKLGLILPMCKKLSCDYIMERFDFLTLEELFSSGLDFYKVSVFHFNPFFLGGLKTRLLRDGDLAVASSHPLNLEITDSTAQKGLTLLWYAQRKGIRPKEIMAVGDSENDRSMLCLPLGLTAAMENGVESIKDIAQWQTRSNAEDGVAYAIETWILGEKEQAC